MSRTTFVRIVIAAFIILVLAAASVIVVRTDAASQADALQDLSISPEARFAHVAGAAAKASHQISSNT